MSKTEISAKGFRWVSFIKPGEADAAFLRDECHFRALDVEDCLTPSQRSKLDRNGEYLFLVLLFPSYNREKKIIEPFEIDIFLTRDTLYSIQDRNGPVLGELFRTAGKSDTAQTHVLGDGPVKLLETILHRLLTATYPMIDHISLDVREIEQRLFRGNERAFLEELLVVRRNVAVFRKTMHAHKFVIRKLMNTLSTSPLFGPLGDLTPSFENLVEHTKEIWDAIDIQKEEVETLATTNETLISHRLNEIMKKFTTISVMIFAMTLLAGLFTIRANGTPFIGIRNAFWIILLIEACIAAVLYGIFKRKRWL